MPNRSLTLVILLATGCLSEVPRVDAGIVAMSDAGPSTSDAGRVDSGVVDAGSPVVDAGPIDSGCAPHSGIGAPFSLRAVAANLTSGNAQSYDPGEGQRILQGIHPDIVMIQEFKVGTNTDAGIAGFASSLSGDDAGMHVWRGTVGNLPNGVISRWPIIEAGDWVDPQVDNRGFTWAHVDLPGPRELWVVSVHFLTSNATERRQEATALIAQLQVKVPNDDFLLIGGDFNTDNRGEGALTTLSARVMTNTAHPVDQGNDGDTSASRSKPYDWVLGSSCLVANQVPVQVGSNQFTGGLVVDTRIYTPITDLAPALQSDSAATNMQHMAVVKDFVIAP